MIIKAELIQDKLFVLTADGTISRFTADYRGQIIVNIMTHISQEQVNNLMKEKHVLLLDEGWLL
jgi:hypothetical protein